MKLFTLKSVVLTIIGLASANFASAEFGSSCKWSQMAEKKGCFLPNCQSGQFPMAVVPLVGFDNQLYSISDKSVWTSPNGISWNSQPKTDWGARHGMRFAFFKNKIWMLGGMKTWDDFRNDVWVSEDGKNWTQTISKAKWSPRRGHGLVVFKNKLWLLGGSLSSGRSNQTPTQALNDVWNSADGKTWSQVTANAPWSAREIGAVLVFDHKLWMIGGDNQRDVWSSADGKNWVLMTADAGWGERVGNGGLVFDGKIWIFGGVGKNDVWNSADGKNWQMVFANSPWSNRNAAYSVVFNDKLWLFSGKTGREDSWDGNIWAMSKAD